MWLCTRRLSPLREPHSEARHVLGARVPREYRRSLSRPFAQVHDFKGEAVGTPSPAASRRPLPSRERWGSRRHAGGRFPGTLPDALRRPLPSRERWRRRGTLTLVLSHPGRGEAVGGSIFWDIWGHFGTSHIWDAPAGDTVTARPPYLARAKMSPKCPKSVRVLSSGRAVTLTLTSPIKGEGIIGADVEPASRTSSCLCVCRMVESYES